MSLPVPTSSEGLKNSREREGERGGWNQKYNDDGEARAFFPFLSVSIFLSHFLSLWLLFYYALSRVEHQLTGRCCPVERLPRVRGGMGCCGMREGCWWWGRGGWGCLDCGLDEVCFLVFYQNLPQRAEVACEHRSMLNLAGMLTKKK